LYRDRILKEGAPVKMKSGDRGFSCSFYVDPEQRKILEEIRWREHKSFSEIVRKAVDEFIKSHQEGNDTFRLDKWQEDPEFQAVPTILAPTQKWYSYLNDCDKDDLTKIAVSAKNILKQIEYYRKK
jgi:hypothetical protein